MYDTLFSTVSDFYPISLQDDESIGRFLIVKAPPKAAALPEIMDTFISRVRSSLDYPVIAVCDGEYHGRTDLVDLMRGRDAENLKYDHLEVYH